MTKEENSQLIKNLEGLLKLAKEGHIENFAVVTSVDGGGRSFSWFGADEVLMLGMLSGIQQQIYHFDIFPKTQITWRPGL